MCLEDTYTEKSLVNEFGYWNEHPKYQLDGWEYAVRQKLTRQSYWAWVVGQLEIAALMEEINTETPPTIE